MNSNICSSFGLCASCVLGGDYESQKAQKIERSKEIFKSVYGADFQFFSSPELGFRTRAEFSLWHDENGVHYAMHGKDGKALIIKNCAIVNEKIADLMPRILEFLNTNEALKSKIFGCEFVSSKHEICVILLYHKDIFSIKNELEGLANELKINLIARSRGKKLVFGSDTLNDEISVNSRILKYKISPDAFIQPNAYANANMLNFVLENVKNAKDLCELYCGHGNFSVALAPLFSKVLATEISKTSTALAKINAKENGANNVFFARLSASEFSAALSAKREFRRLKDIDLKTFDFSHILVDPPRAGCDESVLCLMRKFENIIYVSCNQQTMLRDLKVLCNTHKITSFALFDQFVHTEHIESICVLKRI